MIDIKQEPILRLMLGCLLFRLGGEQTFTVQEIDEIKTVVQGVQVFALEDDRIMIKSRGPEAVERAIESGNVI